MKENAYMTLEASLIVPLVLYVCLFIIYLSFYLYDRCLFTQDCYRIALRGSSVYKGSNQEVYNVADTYINKISAGKYITDDYLFNINVDQTITVNVNGSYIVPVNQFIYQLTGKNWSINITSQSKCLSPTTIIRFIREFQEKR